MKTAYNAIENNRRNDISCFKVVRPATKQDVNKANKRIKNLEIKSYTKVRLF